MPQSDVSVHHSASKHDHEFKIFKRTIKKHSDKMLVNNTNIYPTAANKHKK